MFDISGDQKIGSGGDGAFQNGSRNSFAFSAAHPNLRNRVPDTSSMID